MLSVWSTLEDAIEDMLGMKAEVPDEEVVAELGE